MYLLGNGLFSASECHNEKAEKRNVRLSAFYFRLNRSPEILLIFSSPVKGLNK